MKAPLFGSGLAQLNAKIHRLLVLKVGTKLPSKRFLAAADSCCCKVVSNQPQRLHLLHPCILPLNAAMW